MSKLQIGVISSALVLFLILSFGFDTKPKAYKEVKEKRNIAATSANIGSLLTAAKKNLDPSHANMILAIERQLENASVDSVKIDALKNLSRIWYEQGNIDIAGYFAMEIANIENSEEAWSIAGTTFSICVQRTEDEKVKSFCSENAVKAYESAIYLSPNNPQHQLNLSLLYAEYPPKDNPMKGVMMLLELNEQYPEHVGILTNLGRLGIKTSQFEKAVQRLEKALEIEPENLTANCLIVKAYEGLEELEKAQNFQKKCEELSKILN